MTCLDTESLILAERDGALTPAERAALSDHVAACPACQTLRTQLAASLEAYKAGIASVAVPDVDAAWRDLRAKLREPARPAKKHPLAPVIWFGAPLAAAAAIAFAFLVNTKSSPELRVSPAAVEVAALAPPPPPPPPVAVASVRDANAEAISAEVARADFVEVGDTNASTMVYVDKDSGWLVVWATDISDTPTS